jgi:predicted O-linked N-acetylglucosamine transferase (SPINDLY family)
MGTKLIDYIVADKTVITQESKKYFSEKIVFMPDSYQVNDKTRPLSSKNITRKDVGLPEDAFVYCCFNNNYKIIPATFDSWARILKAVPNSVLWLFQDNEFARDNLIQEIANRGIDQNRLIFANRMPLPEHLSRQALGDLFLDTLPYNAHTTASDALWVGLPLLTLIGKSFPSRVAASLLKAVGLEELITQSRKEFESLAIKLAANPIKLRLLREKLSSNRETMPLFDTQAFVRNIELAYKEMMNLYRGKKKSRDIDVAKLIVS